MHGITIINQIIYLAKDAAGSIISGVGNFVSGSVTDIELLVSSLVFGNFSEFVGLRKYLKLA